MPPPDITPLIHSAGVAVGFLLALLLLTARRGNTTANRWLAAYVSSLALLAVGDVLEETRWVLQQPDLAHLFDCLIFVPGPCVWIYVRRLTLHTQPRGRRLALHFIPALACVALLLPFYFASEADKQRLIAEDLARAGSLDPTILIAAVQILAYWIASLRSLLRFAEQLKQRYSSIEKRSLSWLRWILAINLCMWGLWVLGLLLQTPWAAWLDAIVVPLGLYALALLGLRQPALFADTPTEPRPAIPAPTEGVAPAPKRYARSGLSQEQATQALERLSQTMQLEKPWLENDLTLAQLAERVGASPHHLSQLLNESMRQSFFDYVNVHRVREAQRCLADPAYQAQTVLDIGFSSGFNSKAAFNAAFKKHTGLTPSQFRNQRARDGAASV